MMTHEVKGASGGWGRKAPDPNPWSISMNALVLFHEWNGVWGPGPSRRRPFCLGPSGTHSLTAPPARGP